MAGQTIAERQQELIGSGQTQEFIQGRIKELRSMIRFAKKKGDNTLEFERVIMVLQRQLKLLRANPSSMGRRRRRKL